MSFKTGLLIEQILCEKIVPGRERLVTRIFNLIEGKKPSRNVIRHYLKNLEKTDKQWLRAMRTRMDQIGDEDQAKAFFFSVLSKRAALHFQIKGKKK